MKRSGQSTLEYAVIIAVIVGALLAMQHYTAYILNHLEPLSIAKK